MNLNGETSAIAWDGVIITSQRAEAANSGSCANTHQTPQTHQTHQTHQSIRFAVVRNHEGPATKRFRFDAGGKLVKEAAAQIYDGSVRIVEAADLQEVLAVIDTLTPSETVTYGIPCRDEARIVTQGKLVREGPTAIARDREHFAFANGPAVLMLDHDPRPGHPPLHWHDIDRVLAEVVPGWATVSRIWRPSASAFIYSSEGEELIGMGGWRGYAVVDHGTAIPDVGAYLYQELWRRGHGYMAVSKAGLTLDRSLVDASVWQPERLDFAAGVLLGAGLERRAPPSQFIPGHAMLRTADLRPEVPMPVWRATSPEIAVARVAVQREAAAARKAYVRSTVSAYRARRPNVPDAALRSLLTRAVERRCLAGPFELLSADGRSVSVADLLADPLAWDGARFADPLEPSYRNDRRIAVARLTGPEPPTIFSHAHGGVSYGLTAQSGEISLERGRQPQAVDEAIAVLRTRGEIFERGGELVRISAVGIIPITDEWLTDYIARHVRLTRPRAIKDRTIMEPMDPPPWLARRILAKSGERGLQELRAVITAPTMRPDGSLVDAPGFDVTSSLFLQPGTWPSIPEYPTSAELIGAAATLWRPFAKFPFVDDVSRGVMVAAILSAAVRPTLPRCPAFSIDAPAAGSGKTLLAMCLAALCGMDASVIPEVQNEQEFGKRLFSALRAGKAALIFDNLRGQFRSPALEAMLTAESYSDRLLGASSLLTLPTRTLTVFSGNNLRFGGDLWRRVVTLRLDAKMEAPERRSFAFDPLEYCRGGRQEIIAAALTLLRGFVVTWGVAGAVDKLASFEDWDRLVRQAVLWIDQRQLMPDGVRLDDPVKSIERAKAVEPGRQQLESLLSAAFAVMQSRPWRVADLVTAARFESSGGGNPTSEEILAEIANEIAGENSTINARKLGRWLERHVDQRCKGLWLTRAGTRAHAVLWKIGSEKSHE